MKKNEKMPDFDKIKSSRKQSKQLLLVGLMFIMSLFLINSVSAWTFDDVFIEGNLNPNTGYPSLEIKNCDFWLGTCLNKGETLFQGSVTEHTKQCGEDCSSKMEFNHTGGILIDDIRFLTEQDDSSWIKQDVRSYNLKYEAELPQYETQCTELEEVCTWSEENQTNSCYTPQECTQVQTGTYMGFKNYNVGDTLPSGYYEMFLEAEKKPSRTVDWQIKVEGRWMEEWAVWQSDIEVNLKEQTGSLSSGTYQTGIKFNVTENLLFRGTTTFPSNTGTKAYLKYVNGSLIESSTITSNYAPFNSQLLTTETYILTIDSNGGTYTFGGRTDVTYPFTENPIKVIDSEDEDNFGSSSWYASIRNITYINLSESSITLNSPTDNYISDTDSVTFNATANVTNGAYLTNMSLWTNFTGTWALNKTIFFEDTNFTEATGQTLPTGFSQAGCHGWTFTPNQDITITGATRKAGTTGTTAYLKTTADVTITTGTFSGNKATFRADLTNGTKYVICTIGDSYYETLSVDPFYSGTYYNANKGWNAGAETTFSSRSILSLDFEVSNENTSSTQTWSKTISDTTIWNVEACDTDGDCGFATSNFTVGLDTTAPTVSVENPTGIYDYGYAGEVIDLNVTFTDTNLEDCWYEYNNTNTTIAGCLTGVKNSTSLEIEEGDYEITFYANDSVSNLLEETINWSYKVFETGRTFNNQSYETQQETYSINVTANSSLTDVKLVFNGTEYSTSQTGTVYNKTFDLPTTSLGNNSVRWKFTYAGDDYYSYYSYQQVNETIFTICNATYTEEYLNLTFNDEATLTEINSSLPLSQFEYYLGSGTVTKDYEYINAGSQEYAYEFCATPNLTLHVDPYVQYSASGYPQRIWDPEVTDYTSTMSTEILYLLSSADGLYTTLQVINSADQLISGVLITAIRSILGSDVTVASGTTNAAGSVTYWLNPDFVHDFSLSKAGYTTYETSFAPTQTSYTFTIGGADGNIQNSTQKGIDYEINPEIGTLLYNGTEYDFTYTLTSGYYDVSDYGFNLRLANGTELDGGNTGTEGTELSLTYNTANESYIYIDYYWTVNGETIERSAFWIVQNTQYTGWSIKTFADDISIYLASGIFGLDDFGRLLITFIILFFTVGIMSYKYGFNSAMSINTLVFAVVFFLDIGLGLIPDLRGISNLPTYVAALILVITVIREGQR